MATFVQLSKIQKKFWGHQFAKNRREHQHDLNYPSAELKAQQAQAAVAEVHHLAVQQAADDMANSHTPIEVVRYNNAVKAQDAYRKGVTRRVKETAP